MIHLLVSGPVLTTTRPSLAENITVLLPVQGHPAVLPSTVEFVKPLVSHQQILCRHDTVLNVWRHDVLALEGRRVHPIVLLSDRVLRLLYVW